MLSILAQFVENSVVGIESAAKPIGVRSYSLGRLSYRIRVYLALEWLIRQCEESARRCEGLQTDSGAGRRHWKQALSELPKALTIFEDALSDNLLSGSTAFRHDLVFPLSKVTEHWGDGINDVMHTRIEVNTVNLAPDILPTIVSPPENKFEYRLRIANSYPQLSPDARELEVGGVENRDRDEAVARAALIKRLNLELVDLSDQERVGDLLAAARHDIEKMRVVYDRMGRTVQAHLDSM